MSTKNVERAVVVVDRGWIYAGDVDETSRPGRIILTRAVWVKTWDGCWFDNVLKDPFNKKVSISAMDFPVDLPRESEIFRIPVGEDWGLKPSKK